MAVPKTKKRIRWQFLIGYSLFLLLVLLLAGEIAVRVMGYSPWEVPEQSFEISPGDSFFQEDSLLGYAGRPGTFDIVLNHSLNFRVSHNADGYRVCGTADTVQRPEIWIFGCSFTHGFGVNDTAAYPWRLQERFPAYTFRNFGMSGYGTLQSKMQFERLLKLRGRPAMVMLAYGAFHDQRNTSNRYWRKVLSGSEITAGLRYPHVRFNAQDSLEVGYSRLEYTPFPAMGWSAFAHYLELSYNRVEDHRLRSAEVSLHLIRQMRELANGAAVPFVLVGIFQHEETSKMLETFAQKGCNVIDISQDQEDPALRILPSDGHPNAASHRLMADKLGNFLISNFPNFNFR
ncbi:MAG TPA: SGNH/GDSL hydrolase family protein [Bacteroidetes bacterium]|nr:SGNH/GDSL hydrolase family protein [Bacteroidota bacterium]